MNEQKLFFVTVSEENVDAHGGVYMRHYYVTCTRKEINRFQEVCLEAGKKVHHGTKWVTVQELQEESLDSIAHEHFV